VNDALVLALFGVKVVRLQAGLDHVCGVREEPEEKSSGSARRKDAPAGDVLDSTADWDELEFCELIST